MTMLHYVTGDLNLIINELDVDVLASQTSGQDVLAHITKEFAEYMDKELPRTMERALFMQESRRHKHESMIQYVARKKQLIQELDRTHCVPPDTAKGYILLRDALLPDRAWDTRNLDAGRLHLGKDFVRSPEAGEAGSRTRHYPPHRIARLSRKLIL